MWLVFFVTVVQHNILIVSLNIFEYDWEELVKCLGVERS